MTYRVCVLPGDGIGPDVTAAALRVLERRRRPLRLLVRDRGAPLRRRGASTPPATPSRRHVRAAARASDAVLKGAVGGPRWDGGAVRPEQGHPARCARARGVRQPPPRPPLVTARVIEPAAARAGRGHRPDDRPRADRRPLLRRAGPRRRRRPSTPASTRADEIQPDRPPGFRARPHAPRQADARRQGERARHVPALARGRRRDVAREYPDVRLEHQLVDSMSDEAGRAAGRLRRDRHREPVRRHPLRPRGVGRAAASASPPSASLGDGGPGLFEPIHGSAPDIAGTGRANPAAMILTGAMLLRELGETAAADALEAGRQAVLDDGPARPTSAAQPPPTRSATPSLPASASAPPHPRRGERRGTRSRRAHAPPQRTPARTRAPR